MMLFSIAYVIISSVELNPIFLKMGFLCSTVHDGCGIEQQ
jgi:hypothetical protein